MGDLRVQTNFMVDATPEIKMMWVDVKIQEKKSTIAGIKQLIEDLEKGKILDLKAKAMMHEKELELLIQSKTKGDVIDV
jgi:hypothetical protein